MSKHPSGDESPKPYLVSPLFRKATIDEIIDNDALNDKKPVAAHNRIMNDINREEIDAKLQLIEERLDRKIGDISSAISDLKTSNQAAVSALSSAKWWAIGTAIAVLTVFLGTLQWGLSAQKEENARFNSYVREDIKGIADDAKEISRAVTEMRIKIETRSAEPQK